MVFNNSISSESCGVILINKKLNFVLLKQFIDDDDGITRVEVLINGVKAVLCNIFAPNTQNPILFNEVKKMQENTDAQIIPRRKHTLSNFHECHELSFLQCVCVCVYLFYILFYFPLISVSLVYLVTGYNAEVTATTDYALVELHLCRSTCCQM